MNNTTQTRPVFKNGDKITILSVSYIANSTIKEIITIIGPDKNGHYQCSDGYEISYDSLVFYGDKIPYKIDAEFNTYASNGRINIVSTDNPEKIKSWIKENNINPHFENWENIRWCNADKPDLDSQYKSLY